MFENRISSHFGPENGHVTDEAGMYTDDTLKINHARLLKHVCKYLESIEDELLAMIDDAEESGSNSFVHSIPLPLDVYEI